MNPTPESLEQTAAAMRAFSEGKLIQSKQFMDQEWGACVSPRWFLDTHEYRPKPELATVPWDCADDVPGPVCYLRIKDEPYSWSMVLGAGKKGIIVPDYHGKLTFNYEELERVEHSTDRKTWHPCTKEAKA